MLGFQFFLSLFKSPFLWWIWLILPIFLGFLGEKAVKPQCSPMAHSTQSIYCWLGGLAKPVTWNSFQLQKAVGIWWTLSIKSWNLICVSWLFLICPRIIITRTAKYPLLVDPQGQGLQWLRTRNEALGVCPRCPFAFIVAHQFEYETKSFVLVSRASASILLLCNSAFQKFTMKSIYICIC